MSWCSAASPAATRSIPPRTRRACAMLPSHSRSSPCRSEAGRWERFTTDLEVSGCGRTAATEDHAVRALRCGSIDGWASLGSQAPCASTPEGSGKAPHRRRGGQRRRPGCAITVTRFSFQPPKFLPAPRALRIQRGRRRCAWSETGSRSDVLPGGFAGGVRAHPAERASNGRARCSGPRGPARRVVVRAVRGPGDVGRVAKGRFRARAKFSPTSAPSGSCAGCRSPFGEERPGGGRFSPKACGYRRLAHENCVTTSCDYPVAWNPKKDSSGESQSRRGQICAAIVLRSGGQSTPSGRACRPGNPPRTRPDDLHGTGELSQLDTSADPKTADRGTGVATAGPNRRPRTQPDLVACWLLQTELRRGLFVGALAMDTGVRVSGRRQSVRDARALFP